MPLTSAIRRHRPGLPYCCCATDCRLSPCRIMCVERPGRPPEVGLVGNDPRRLGWTCMSMFTSARIGMPLVWKRVYVALTDVITTAYMKPSSGGPHWKVTVGGLDEIGMPAMAEIMVARPAGGPVHASRVSTRSLVVSPVKMTPLRLSLAGSDWERM